jgi:hypothetical protein
MKPKHSHGREISVQFALVAQSSQLGCIGIVVWAMKHLQKGLTVRGCQKCARNLEVENGKGAGIKDESY